MELEVHVLRVNVPPWLYPTCLFARFNSLVSYQLECCRGLLKPWVWSARLDELLRLFRGGEGA